MLFVIQLFSRSGIWLTAFTEKIVIVLRFAVDSNFGSYELFAIRNDEIVFNLFFAMIIWSSFSPFH